MAEIEKPKCTNCGRTPIVKITDLSGVKEDLYFCEKDLNKFCIATLKATLNTEPAPKEKIEKVIETPKGGLKE